MARMDKEQWAIIRERWERDPRTGYAWLIEELSIELSIQAMQIRAKRDGWTKKASPAHVDVVDAIVDESTKDPEQQQRPIGRPTKFKEEYIEQAFQLALLGCTDEEMADVFGVDVRTLDNWKVAYPDFFQSIKRGKIPADAVVATSLYDRARGYAHEDVHISNHQGEITVTPIIKHYPPDFQSMSLWLRNRQPKKWRKDVDVPDETTDPFPPVDVLDEIKRKGMEEAARKEAERQMARDLLGINVSGLLKTDG